MIHDLTDPRLLVGRWRLHRVIDDRRAGERSVVTGELLISPDQDGLLWQESGRWERAAGAVDVRRTLHLTHAPAESRWWVCFEDGRPFHPWAPGEQVVHPCGRDTYTGHVSGDLRGWNVDWLVTGPEKDYTMTSQLTALE